MVLLLFFISLLLWFAIAIKIDQGSTKDREREKERYRDHISAQVIVEYIVIVVGIWARLSKL